MLTRAPTQAASTLMETIFVTMEWVRMRMGTAVIVRVRRGGEGGDTVNRVCL